MNLYKNECKSRLYDISERYIYRLFPAWNNKSVVPLLKRYLSKYLLLHINLFMQSRFELFIAIN